MAEIIPLPTSQAATPMAFIQESRDILANNYMDGEQEVVSVIVAYKCKDGTVLTGYHNADFGTKQEMLGHIQCDVIDQMIRANPDRYGF